MRYENSVHKTVTDTGIGVAGTAALYGGAGGGCDGY